MHLFFHRFVFISKYPLIFVSSVVSLQSWTKLAGYSLLQIIGEIARRSASTDYKEARIKGWKWPAIYDRKVARSIKIDNTGPAKRDLETLSCYSQLDKNKEPSLRKEKEVR